MTKNVYYGKELASQVQHISNIEFKKRIKRRSAKEYDIDIGMSGCTCTLAIIIDKTVYYGFIGDSLMCLSRRMNDNMELNTKNNELIMTKPFHLPNEPTERIRIFNSKGEVRGEKIKKPVKKGT